MGVRNGEGLHVNLGKMEISSYCSFFPLQIPPLMALSDDAKGQRPLRRSFAPCWDLKGEKGTVRTIPFSRLNTQPLPVPRPHPAQTPQKPVPKACPATPRRAYSLQL
ncbi:hypothetical protein DWY69_21180 [Eisenbergiella massiliensis]|uniref:Uncharacterized protein n=1 Tax=Eisenbergiella massiliensis TaxID=1720294 RepID=A0A3E3ILI2_9FIRM|nr:hypothetical protein DWY69_21180 [Eisenbergiella massiliensis]